MILIGQTIMSPNGDRNFILTQCEFSVDFSFLRSLRASQLDAIYYILIKEVHIYVLWKFVLCKDLVVMCHASCVM